jgi:hypothetical protein
MERLLVGIAIAVAALILSGGSLREIAAHDSGPWMAQSAPVPQPKG